MKKLYTIFGIFLLLTVLAGCTTDASEAYGISNAFIRNCKVGTIRTNIASEGITKTLTITCNKDGN